MQISSGAVRNIWKNFLPVKIEHLFIGTIPPRLMRLVKTAGKGINRFQMIKDGEKLLLGISGGKDSLVLALALSLRKKWIPIDYELEAVQIDWNEYPLTTEQKEKLTAFFKAISVPFRLIPTDMFSGSFNNRFNCYLCSRNRKRILFNEAERLGFRKIALGHHMDDIIETTLINLSLHGSFATMMPVQDFFGGEIRLIRPLCLIKERSIDNIVDFLGLPVAKVDCPYKDTNIRKDMKQIVRHLSHINKQARKNIFEAPWHINHEYLPHD